MSGTVSFSHRCRRWGLVLGLSGASCGIMGCVGLPFGGFIPEVMLDTSALDRSGFSRASLAGTWSVTNAEGQTRTAVFDSAGSLVSFELPSGESFNGSEAGFVEDILLTTFGAVSVVFRNDSSASGGSLVIHEFEGTRGSDDRVKGIAVTLQDFPGVETQDFSVERATATRNVCE